MAVDSPFTLNRFEYEQKHLYHLPEKTFGSLLVGINTYLIGSRGTGKTTLLKALDWTEQKSNPQLRNELDKFHLAPNSFIGIYLKSSIYAMEKLDTWLFELSIDDYNQLFVFYIDLLVIEQIIKAIEEARDANIIEVPLKEEHDFVMTISKEFPFLQLYFKESKYFTLCELVDILNNIQKELFLNATKKINPMDMFEKFGFLERCGEFGRKLSIDLGEYYDKHSKNKESKIQFKICFDESECFSFKQQLAFNTLFRLSCTPLQYIVSYVVEPEDLTTTAIQNQTLSAHDRKLIKLDNWEDNKEEFKLFVNGVSTIRCQARLNPVQKEFDLKKLTDNTDLNGLLQKKFKKSENNKIIKLLKFAKDLSDHPVYALKQKRKSSHSLPITEAYILGDLGTNISDLKTLRGKESETTRKKKPMAYFSICRKFSIDPEYSGEKIILHLSDYCIRDFLRILDEMYITAGMKLLEFIEKNGIDSSIQSKAIKEASEQKFKSIPKLVDTPQSIGKLVHAIGLLTKELQKNDKLVEYGLYNLNFSSGHYGESKIVALVKEAHHYGFLKIIDESPKMIIFRLHNSLAAKYDLSYRGGYYKKTIDYVEIESIIISEEGDLPQSMKRLGKKMLKIKTDNETEQTSF